MASLIALEGIDGSGKGTQSKRLAETLTAEGHCVQLLGFPRYEETFFGQRIGEFLNGRFGSLDDVAPFFASLLYAGDRFESKVVLEDALNANDYVILDRYVASNIAHQAGKLDGDARQELIQWIEQIEFEIYQLPQPDRVVLLDIPETISRQLVAKKAARSYTDQEADLQEADSSYQAAVRRSYLDLAEQHDEWRVVPVTSGGELRPIEEIAADVRTSLD